VYCQVGAEYEGDYDEQMDEAGEECCLFHGTPILFTLKTGKVFPVAGG
jgi:hypothetical protein